MTRTLRTALILALGLAAMPARAGGLGLDLSIHGGLDKYDAVGLKSGLDATDFTSKQQLKDASQSYGATALLHLGGLEVGAIGEVGRPGKTNSTTVIGALAGLDFGLGPIRIDALVEAGGHRYGDALDNPAVITGSKRSDWLTYVGLRPGVAFQLSDHLFVGVWGFARWDVTKKTITVPVAGQVDPGVYKVGGSQFGAQLRLGFSI
jgi:hypothetical protein